jgi:dihydrofolate reductase
MNKVFIATSLDGFIADEHGSVDFLYKYPEPPGEDMGYYNFMTSVDALLMGRKTFETVLGFGVEWPYTKPVYVWSSTLKSIPTNLVGKVQVVNGTLSHVISQLDAMNHVNLYIDGAKTIQSFLNENLIDEMTITTIPVLLGSGIPLFHNLLRASYFTCVESKHYPHGLTQSKYTKLNRD